MRYNAQFTGDAVEVTVFDRASLQQNEEEAQELMKELKFDIEFRRPTNQNYLNNVVNRFIGDLI